LERSRGLEPPSLGWTPNVIIILTPHNIGIL
jgi:hypothetical protein